MLNASRTITCRVLLAVGFLTITVCSPQNAAAVLKPDLYAQYLAAGVKAYQNNEADQAIDWFQKAVPLTLEDPKPSLYTNLGTTYTKRGKLNYDQGRLEASLSDARMAYYYMHYFIHYGAHLSHEMSDVQRRNDIVSEGNLKLLYAKFNVGPQDVTFHLTEARKLAGNKKFPEALVEYGEAADQNAAEALSEGERVAKKLGLSTLFRTEVYREAMSRKLKALWAPKVSSQPYQVGMTFRIQRDGTVTDAAIQSSSKNAQADEQALQTVRDLRRFDPPPKFMIAPGSNEVVVQFVFDYLPDKKPKKSSEPPATQ